MADIRVKLDKIKTANGSNNLILVASDSEKIGGTPSGVVLGRVALLERVIFNDIDTNPYLIMFDDLVGVLAGGVWDAEKQALVC